MNSYTVIDYTELWRFKGVPVFARNIRLTDMFCCEYSWLLTVFMVTHSIHGYLQYSWLLTVFMVTYSIHGYSQYSWLLTVFMVTYSIHGYSQYSWLLIKYDLKIGKYCPKYALKVGQYGPK